MGPISTRASRRSADLRVAHRFASVGRRWETLIATGCSGQILVRVDVTDEFPFLVTKLSPYYDR